MFNRIFNNRVTVHLLISILYVLLFLMKLYGKTKMLSKLKRWLVSYSNDNCDFCNYSSTYSDLYYDIICLTLLKNVCRILKMQFPK